MSQRNPMNERYSDDARTGKTRKSSASAKPKAARAATLRDPAPKTKKQKKEEARERERVAAQKANAIGASFESTDEYKRLRRLWWIALGGAIACTAISVVTMGNEDATIKALSMGVMVFAYVLIIIAFYIDLGKIRKGRKKFEAELVASKSKEARREQKRIRAELRAQEKEAAEKFDEAKAEEEAKAAKRGKGLFGRFGAKSKDEASAQPDSD